MVVDYMTDHRLLTLDVEQLEANRLRRGNQWPSGKPAMSISDRVVIALAVPQDLDRCRCIVMGVPVREPVPIAEQLHCCLYALSASTPSTWSPEIQVMRSRAQSTLSELLMRHPVLMHPELRCVDYHSSNGSPEFHPMPMGVVSPLYARLPMKEDGYGQDELKAWALHVGPKTGLFTKTPDDSSLDPMVTGLLPIEHATRLRQWRPELLASLHELITLRDGKPNPSEVLAHCGKVNSEQRMLVLTMSLLYACEMASPAAARFVEILGTSYEPYRPSVAETVQAVIPAALALGRGTGTSVTERVNAYATGLVNAGVASSMEDAARRMLKACIAEPNAALNDVAVASEFLRAIRALGVVPQLDELIPHVAVKKPMPSWEIAHRQVEAEAAMNAVLGGEVAARATTSAPRRARAL